MIGKRIAAYFLATVIVMLLLTGWVVLPVLLGLYTPLGGFAAFVLGELLYAFVWAVFLALKDS